MNVISTIKFPKVTNAAALYMQCNENVEVVEPGKMVAFKSGGKLSLNTYFNSLFEAFYTRYTSLRSLYFLLTLEGDFRVEAYREWYGNDDREQVTSETFEQCQPGTPITFQLPDLIEGDRAGRIYIELTCLSEQGQFLAGSLMTEQPKHQDVSLAIVCCTFKKETYIRNTVDAVLQNESLGNQKLKVFVVDNGQTLAPEDFSDARVQLIPNRNVGGSGGFTRGIIEALDEADYTHLVCMDDDVELEGESIQKLISFYEYADTDMAISGAMLDLCKRYVLYEAGATHARKWFKDGFDPFELTPQKHKLDLRESASLNALLSEEKIDYGGFWFFAFPKKFVDEIGLPMPFFIKIDDIEFGLRISQTLQKKIIAFPAIAVWHEPFYLKFPVWDTYYYFRNYLIAHATLGSLTYWEAIADISKRIFYTLLFFDYNSSRMLVKAFEDFFKGPDFIRNTDPVALHSEILKLSKHHQNLTIKQNYLLADEFIYSQKARFFQKIGSLLTLNGHFLPDFMLKDEPAYVYLAPDRPGQRSRALAHKRVSLFKELAASLYEYEMDKKAGFSILRDWLKLVISNGARWSDTRKAWKDAAPEFTSTPFWKQYLKMGSGEVSEKKATSSVEVGLADSLSR